MKKILISIMILIVLWSGVWCMLAKYESSLPNSNITAFSKTIFNDLDNIKIVKETENNNLFNVYKNDNKLITVLALKDDKNWKVSLEENYIEPIKLYIPAGANVYVNDELLNTQNIVEYTEESRFSIIKDTNLLPKIECYQLENYVDIPNIKVIYNGKECNIEIDGRKINAYIILTKDESKELENLLIDTSKAYARYITNDSGFSEIKKYLYEKTDFYKELKGFYNGWYNSHSGYEFRDIEIKKLKKVSENAFIGEISFEHVIKNGRKEYDYLSRYEIYFIKVDNKWKAICIDTL